jgi:hypothetical protein
LNFYFYQVEFPFLVLNHVNLNWQSLLTALPGLLIANCQENKRKKERKKKKKGVRFISTGNNMLGPIKARRRRCPPQASLGLPGFWGFSIF